MKYIGLSPDENYILVGKTKYVYLYNIQTELNIKIYKEETMIGLFKQNSTQIILVTQDRIINNINSSKKQQNIILNGKISKILYCFINKNCFFLACHMSSQFRFFQIDLNQNHQIFSLRSRTQVVVQVNIFEELIALNCKGCLKQLDILDYKLRKSRLLVNSQLYKFTRGILINKNQLLCIGDYGALKIMNIDYQNYSLIEHKVLLFSANELYRGNQSFGYFYISNFYQFQIIDENYNSINTDIQGISFKILFNQTMEKPSQYLRKMVYTYQKDTNRADIFNHVFQFIYILQNNSLEQVQYNAGEDDNQGYYEGDNEGGIMKGITIIWAFLVKKQLNVFPQMKRVKILNLIFMNSSIMSTQVSKRSLLPQLIYKDVEAIQYILRDNPEFFDKLIKECMKVGKQQSIQNNNNEHKYYNAIQQLKDFHQCSICIQFRDQLSIEKITQIFELLKRVQTSDLNTIKQFHFCLSSMVINKTQLKYHLLRTNILL